MFIILAGEGTLRVADERIAIRAGDVIVFNEALLHNGRPNPSEKTRITLIINFGRADAGPWPGYTPKSATLAAVTPRQRQIGAQPQHCHA